MRSGRVTRGVLVAALALLAGHGRAQAPEAPPADPYAGVWSGHEPVGAPPTARPGPPSEEESARRAEHVASVGSVHVTVGELEDRLARTSTERASGADRRATLRALAIELLRAERLAQAAERRGLAAHPDVRAAERRALVETLLERDFAPESFGAGAEPEAAIPARRRPLVIFERTRAGAARVGRSVRDGDLDAWDRVAAAIDLPEGAPHSGGELGWMAAEPRDGEEPLARALRSALWAIEAQGQASPPIRVGPVWAVVVLTGERAPEGPSSEDEDVAGSWARRDRALDALEASSRREHLRDVRPERLYPIRFELGPPPEPPPFTTRSAHEEVSIRVVEPTEGARR